jgi:hypothetical protein
VRVGRPRAATDIARFLAGLSGGQLTEGSGCDLLPTLIRD